MIPFVHIKHFCNSIISKYLKDHWNSNQYSFCISILIRKQKQNKQTNKQGQFYMSHDQQWLVDNESTQTLIEWKINYHWYCVLLLDFKYTAENVIISPYWLNSWKSFATKISRNGRFTRNKVKLTQSYSLILLYNWATLSWSFRVRFHDIFAERNFTLFGSDPPKLVKLGLKWPLQLEHLNKLVTYSCKITNCWLAKFCPI